MFLAYHLTSNTVKKGTEESDQRSASSLHWWVLPCYHWQNTGEKATVGNHQDVSREVSTVQARERLSLLIKDWRVQALQGIEPTSSSLCQCHNFFPYINASQLILSILLLWFYREKSKEEIQQKASESNQMPGNSSTHNNKIIVLPERNFFLQNASKTFNVSL